MKNNDLIKTLRWIASNDEDVFNADTTNLAIAALEKMEDEIDYLKKRLEIEKDHSAQMERERDAAVADLRKAMLCFACAHSIHYTGIPCGGRSDRPADGSCDFKWRGAKDKKEEQPQ